MNEAVSANSAAKPVAGWHRHSRWLWVLLVCSLAANLFVIGVVARVMWPTRYSAAGAGPAGMLGNLFAYSKELPKDRLSEIRKGLPVERPMLSLQPLRKDLREARLDAARLFRSDPFPREAFLAAEARLIAAEVRLREATAKLVADIAQRMTAEERSSFLKWRQLRRGGGALQGQDTVPSEKDAVTKSP